MTTPDSHPDNPYAATPIGASNAKRRGWDGYFTGEARSACPFPSARMDLLLAYEEGWDAAEAHHDATKSTANTIWIDELDLSLADDPTDYPPGSTIPEEDLRRYAALGRAAEQHGLAWYAPDGKRGEMLFQPPSEIIAEQAVAKFIENNRLTKMSTEPAKADPVPMLLHCPGCGERHIDEGDFATNPHHTHACQGCGMVWRPAIVDTVGVKFLPGFKNDVRS